MTGHRVLVVGVGARSLAVGTLQALRDVADVTYTAGVDASPGAVGREFCDAFSVVPPAAEPSFGPSLAQVLRREAITLVLPLIDAGMATVVDVAAAAGALAVGPDRARLVELSDKGVLLPLLFELGLNPVPAVVPAGRAEVRDAAERCGYPACRVVVKPRVGSGGRGVWLLDPAPRRSPVAGQRGIPTLALEPFLVSLHDSFPWDGMVVSPEAQGDHYTVLFARGSDGNLVVPVRRTSYDCGTTWAGVVERREEVIEFVDGMCSQLDVGPIANVQLAWDGRRCQVWEVNPRLSSTTSSLAAIGLDVVGFVLAGATGRPAPLPAVPWGASFRRYVTDVVEGSGV